MNPRQPGLIAFGTAIAATLAVLATVSCSNSTAPVAEDPFPQGRLVIPRRNHPDINPVNGNLVYEFRGPLAAWDSLWQIRIYDERAREERTVALGFQPDWSPDGTRIAYRSASDGNICLVRVSDGTVQVLTETGCGLFPEWSPDGSTIAYMGEPVFNSENSGIWLVDVESLSRRRVRVHGSCPAWSPDGQSIAYCDYVGGSVTQILIHEIADSTTVQVTSTPQTNYRPNWGAAGLVWDHEVFLDGAPGDLWILRDGETQPRLLATNGEAPSWYPDGSRLLFAGRDSATGIVDLYVINRDGTNRKRLFEP